MKRIYTLILLLFLALSSVFAFSSLATDSLTQESANQSWGKRVLLNVPDSIFVCLPVNLRQSLLDDYCANPNDTASVSNSLNGKTKLTELNEEGFSLQMSENSSVQVFRLCNNSVYEICMIFTRKVDVPESLVYLYSSDWKQRKQIALDFKPESFLRDSLSESERAEALKYVEFPMFYVKKDSSIKEDVVEVSLSLPLLTKDENDKVKSSYVLRKMNILEF